MTGADALEYARSGASLIQVYTGFGYDGAGACRRIKDQLIDELTREDTTWGDVVNKAVNDLSWRAPHPTKKDASIEGTITQLISEAQELKGLLDKLDEKMVEEARSVVNPPDNSAVAVAQTIIR